MNNDLECVFFTKKQHIFEKKNIYIYNKDNKILN